MGITLTEKGRWFNVGPQKVVNFGAKQEIDNCCRSPVVGQLKVLIDTHKIGKNQKIEININGDRCVLRIRMKQNY